MDITELPRLGDLSRTQYRDLMSLEFTKWLSCLAETNSGRQASQLFLTRWPHSAASTLITKAAVAPGTTTDGTWAGPLASVKPLQDAFVAIARSASLLGRIPGLRRVPFNVKVPTETSGANYQWVPENGPKPASAMSFGAGVTLSATKHAAVVVVTQELVLLSVAGMEGALRDTLIGGLTAYTDRQFLDPTVAAVAGKNPASVTNGTTPITATASYQTDVQTLLAAFFAGRPSVQQPVLIANAAHASQIKSWNAGGGVGIDVLVSEAALGNTIAMDPQGIFVADSGVEIDVSREAALQMNDAPDAPVTASTVVTSLWQMNLYGFRVERFVNWAATTGAVKYLAG